jgi:hypothetical protein
MLEDIYVPLCLLAFLSGIIVILIIQQLARGKSRLLNILGVLSGIVLASATFVLAIATIILAANSKAQIGEARAEFETNQRPWVYPDLGPPAGPLSFDQNGAKLTLNNVGFHNTGQTPATSVFPIGILVFDEPEASFLPPARANTQRRRCTAISGTSQGTELAIFPRENLTDATWGFNAKREEIERVKANQQAALEKLPYGILCVDYQFTYTKGHHLTAKLFSLTSDASRPYSMNAGDPPIPVKWTLEGTYAD